MIAPLFPLCKISLRSASRASLCERSEQRDIQFLQFSGAGSSIFSTLILPFEP